MSDSEIAQSAPPLPMVVVGHVDHGKSTLIGRLMYETGSLPESKIKQVEASSRKRGEIVEWAYLLDALQLERDQGITVDTTRIWLRGKQRDYVLIDAPGHIEFVKNMVTGAASAEAAILVVDAGAGVDEQTRRHALLLKLLGIAHVIVAVNKMDLVEYSQERFEVVRDETLSFLRMLEIEPALFLPISARHGDNLTTVSDRTPWHSGMTVLQALEGVERLKKGAQSPLRLPVQSILRRGTDRLILGRIASGTLRVGDKLAFHPHHSTATVEALESWSSDAGTTATALSATTGASVAVRLDRELFVERGQVGSHEENGPLQSRAVRANLFWLGQKPIKIGEKVKMRIGTAEYAVELTDIHQVVDLTDLSPQAADEVRRNEVAQVTLMAGRSIVVDPFAELSVTGRGVLVRDYEIVGGCTFEGIDASVGAQHLIPVGQSVDLEERIIANSHRPAVLWLCGLSGSGKSTLSMALQRRLFARGMQVTSLDGDNLRGGLCNDLGFDVRSRHENIRRAAEVSKLLADTGMVVIASFITPLNEDQDLARRIIGDHMRFIYLDVSVETCVERDPKGLYRKALAGEISDFTGVSAPFDAPIDPDLTITTGSESFEQSLEKLYGFALEQVQTDSRSAGRRSTG